MRDAVDKVLHIATTEGPLVFEQEHEAILLLNCLYVLLLRYEPINKTRAHHELKRAAQRPRSCVPAVEDRPQAVAIRRGN